MRNIIKKNTPFIVFFLVFIPVAWHWKPYSSNTYYIMAMACSVLAPIVACLYFYFAPFFLKKKEIRETKKSRIYFFLKEYPLTCLFIFSLTLCTVYLVGALLLYSETGVSNDEATYLFHAKTFANWRLINPVPPLREFFYSYYILTDPAYIAKSFPGYPAILMWGFLIGFPRLIPPLILFASVFASYWALLPVIGRVSSVLAAMMFATTIQSLCEGTHYYSSAAILLCSPLLFGSIIRYTQKFSTKWVIASGVALAANFLARPFDAFGMGLAATLYVIIQMRSKKIFPFKQNIAGVMIFLILGPLLLMGYNKATVGSYLAGPYTVFSQTYCPESYWLHSPENKQAAPFKTPVAHHHRQYVSTSKGYNGYNTHTVFSEWIKKRLPILLFSLAPWTVILAGIPWIFRGKIRKKEILALIFWPLSHLIYIFYAVGYQLVYSAGITFALIALGVIGLDRFMAWIRVCSGHRLDILRSPALIVGCCFFLVIPINCFFSVGKFHESYNQFYRARDALPDGPKIIFARYGPESWIYLELVQNEPFLAESETIIANDLGPKNNELMTLFPERDYYIYDESAHKIHRIYNKNN